MLTCENILVACGRWVLVPIHSESWVMSLVESKLVPADRAYFGIKSGIDNATTSMWKNNSGVWQMGPGSSVLVSPGYRLVIKNLQTNGYYSITYRN
jgi:hypothetical protein